MIPNPKHTPPHTNNNLYSPLPSSPTDNSLHNHKLINNISLNPPQSLHPKISPTETFSVLIHPNKNPMMKVDIALDVGIKF